MGSHLGVPLFDRKEPRWYKLLAPTASEEFKVVLLANEYTGFGTHWVGRTVGCDRSADCRYCRENSPNRWAGYIPALMLEPRTELFGLSLTPGAARQIHEIEIDHGALRGLHLAVTRSPLNTGGEVANNSPLSLRFILRRPEGRTPPAFDLTYSVQRLYKLNDAAFEKLSAERHGDYEKNREIVRRLRAERDEPAA